MQRLLIAGCGDLGQRLAVHLPDWQVHGLRRKPQVLPKTIQPIRADLSQPETLRAAAGQWDAVVYSATPGERTPQAYRQTYLEGMQALLRHVDARRLIMVSSTAVFGQCRGEWVSESSPTEPASFNGQILLEAEQLARAAGGIVIRFSGIYGPGRDYLIRKVKAGGLRCRRRPPIWTNRIHADDCAGALAHVLRMPAPEPLYLASDALPAPRWEVLNWLAERLGVAGSEEVAEPGDEVDQGKRVSADKLFSSGFELQYPDFRYGYEALLQ
ncbi:MAG: SDR family oxidoreductase [Wenzhouxiangellaceae bacterium]|nr:SDR family oxidoreductase [Wenzhouxiangellaceae bacterium]